MTSVQNHLPLLSGNKNIVLLAVLLLVLQGCSIFQKKDSRPQRDQGEVLEDTLDVSDIDTFKIEVDTLDVPDRMVHKVRYKVAIMLPFSLDSRFMYSYDHEDPKRTPYRSMLALELYEGMLIAMEDLRQQGLKLEVFVYDTENSPERVAQLLNRPVMQEMDLIIGPLFSKTLEVVAPFAKENRIYMVSPLLPNAEISEPNPYYVNATATVESFAETIAKFAIEKYPRSRILVVAREGDEGEARYAANIQKAYEKYGPPQGEIPRVRQVTMATLTENMSARDTNIVVVPALEKWHIKSTAASLSGLAGAYPFITIGMPTWFEMVQSLEEDRVYQNMTNINLHYPSTFFVDNNTDAAKAFQKRVKDRYKVHATENIYKGYDIMYYFGIMLKEYGVNFADYFDERNQSKLSLKYNIQPRLVDDTQKVKQTNIQYYDNRYVPIVRLKDGEFIQVW